jgi:hypothetical protein
MRETADFESCATFRLEGQKLSAVEERLTGGGRRRLEQGKR